MIHAVFDMTGCRNADAPAEQIMTAMRNAAERLGCTIRAQLIEPFQPHGATCVLILAESHITVSTWPEHALAHIDVFTCRALIDPAEAITPIIEVLGGQVEQMQHVPRLAPPPPIEPAAAEHNGQRRCGGPLRYASHQRGVFN